MNATVDFAGDTVTILLADPDAGWIRFAHQSQDCHTMQDATGISMSAHRTTLFGSHSQPSRFVAGETLWRALPSFRGRFANDRFEAL
ncbi:hypothetical protein RM190_15530 [Paracoccus sp. CPCC 101403]|uniref:Uncharacterized protein n=1 Tax=Paracoccus broussonetiae TaxID=3075834 RepID=A0ABU3EGB4_9RHOB|nr:hypothetical protein [Paracoccus sp. CPCC 101403]